MSLRFRINLLITGLMVLFLVITGSIMLDNIRKSIREEIQAGTKVTVQLLTTVIYSSQFVAGNGSQDQVILNFLRTLGRVRANEIQFYNGLGDLIYVSPYIYVSPPSTYKAGRFAPEWFSRLVSPKIPPVTLNLPSGGVIKVIPDASRSALDAWDDLRGLIGLALAFFVLINVLVFWLVGRSLRPVKIILAGLSDMERGRFDARLPEFSLPEMSAISHTFNRMAEALEKSTAENRRLALIVHQSGDAILILDASGNVAFWNPAAERLFGHPAEAVLGKPVAFLTPAEKMEEMNGIIAAVLRREQIENVQTQRLARDGRVLDISLSAFPLVDPKSGHVMGGILSLRDITEKKRAETIARELAQNRQLTQLIRSHVEEERKSLARELHDELGQCATAIKTIGMTIANQTRDRDPAIHNEAQTIVSVAGHLYDVVHGMIRKLRPSVLDHLGLPDALREAIDVWQATHPETHFTLDLSGRLDDLGEDLNIAVYRIVQECLTNAIRHAQASHIHVEVARAQGDEQEGYASEVLRVVVADNGKGMIPGEPAVNSGFGLIGMRERVQTLNGRVAVESGPGTGVRVRAVIPLPARSTIASPDVTPTNPEKAVEPPTHLSACGLAQAGEDAKSC